MSTYNGEKYLTQQLESILKQDCGEKITIIVRDDGSTDSTCKILDKYKALGKLTWYTGENLGAARSFYSLIKDNPGYDYYAFADQDDYWEADKIRCAVDMLHSSEGAGPLLYFANAELVDSKLNGLGRCVYKRMPGTNLETLSAGGGILGCTIVFNKTLAEFIQRAEGIPGKIIMHDSYVSQLCMALGGKIIADERPHMKYRQHGNNVVGVSVTFADKLKNRLLGPFKKAKVSVAEQSGDIIKRFESSIGFSQMQILTQSAEYQKTLISRMRLAFSGKLCYSSRNIGLRNRATILLGNK